MCMIVCEQKECGEKTKYTITICWDVQIETQLENFIIARELESCMWAHKFASKSILLLDLVLRLSPTTGCCKTRRQWMRNEKLRIREPLGLEDLQNWFRRVMKLLEAKVHYREIEVCHMPKWFRIKN